MMQTPTPVVKTAILLVNLGTPEAPTTAAVRRYLAEFLWDPRVVELPRLPWWLMLHGLILNTRPAKSAAKYAQIWTDEGSPLLVHTKKQAILLRGLLGARGYIGARNLEVRWAMRYGRPSIGSALDQLVAEGYGRVLVVPLYPQYARSTTASVEDVLAHWQQRNGNGEKLALRSMPSFPENEGYIAALATAVRRHWQQQGRALRDECLLVMSFHGIPQRSVERGDPYQQECVRTAQRLAQTLGLAEHQWRLTFQSRFGRAAWLQPYTATTLAGLAQAGTGCVDVLCPGFVADCLETLEEIAIENKAVFLAAGGRAFHYIPCLNEQPEWIEALADLVQQSLADWLP